jgi:hypothetical protein
MYNFRANDTMTCIINCKNIAGLCRRLPSKINKNYVSSTMVQQREMFFGLRLDNAGLPGRRHDTTLPATVGC